MTTCSASDASISMKFAGNVLPLRAVHGARNVHSETTEVDDCGRDGLFPSDVSFT